MPGLYLVRTGAFGQLSGYSSAGGERHPRGSRVVVRTPRGLELGEVLGLPDDELADESQGQILRRMTTEDELLATRLLKNRNAAFEACQIRLAELNLNATLIDVEPLFDGRTLVFHFLGEATPALDDLTAELAEAYEAKAEIRRFAETLTSGCGPDCGTEAGSGCGSCSTGCAISSACGSRH